MVIDSDSTDQDRPPICPACGVTQLLSDDGEPKFVCVECGFADDDAQE